jgi:bacterioferritin
MTYFVKDMNTMRRRTRASIALWTMTDAGNVDINVVALLNEAIATELCGVIRYQQHHAMASSLLAHSVARQYLAFSNDNLKNADRLAARVVELGGEPDFGNQGLLTRILDPEAESLLEMVQHDSDAEGIVVDSLESMVKYVADSDVRTRQAFAGVLESEVGHADELSILLGTMTARQGASAAGNAVDTGVATAAVSTATRTVNAGAWETVVLEIDTAA